MTYEDLLADLIKRKALIVHCSRIGKGDDIESGVFFPDDMLKAIRLCDTERKELCCSVIWPGHLETYGEIGIVVKPRSIEAITRVCWEDGGTWLDPETQERDGGGVPFSKQAFEDTFLLSASYNEWNINNADTVGVFVRSRQREPQVAGIVDLSSLPFGGISTAPRLATWEEIAEKFPSLPVLTIEGNEIVDLEGRIISPYE